MLPARGEAPIVPRFCDLVKSDSLLLAMLPPLGVPPTVAMLPDLYLSRSALRRTVPSVTLSEASCITSGPE